jgi:hypothetical protein
MEETKSNAKAESETSPDIEAIVKKPRKPRMSSVVSKAVLLKQMSDADMLKENVEIVVEKTPVPVIDEILPPTSSAKQVKKSKKVVTPPPSPEIVDEHRHPVLDPLSSAERIVITPLSRPEVVVSEIVGECALCNCKFKSKVLFNRHPQTLKHKLNRDKSSHIKKESKK